MSDLSYTTSMVQEIKELLSGARQRAAVSQYGIAVYLLNIGRIIVESMNK